MLKVKSVAGGLAPAKGFEVQSFRHVAGVDGMCREGAESGAPGSRIARSCYRPIYLFSQSAIRWVVCMYRVARGSCRVTDGRMMLGDGANLSKGRERAAAWCISGRFPTRRLLTRANERASERLMVVSAAEYVWSGDSECWCRGMGRRTRN